MKAHVGDRIRLVAMPQDPDPVPVGTCGTVEDSQFNVFGTGEYLLTVAWDNGRTLNVISPPDKFEILARDPT